MLKIPFDKSTGNMYAYSIKGSLTQWTKENIDFIDNYIFEDTLTYIDYKGGRSSMSMILQSNTTSRKYYIFWKYFDWLIRQPGLKDGPTFNGSWTFVKTGQNYSVKPANYL